jgi:hypothetical protein
VISWFPKCALKFNVSCGYAEAERMKEEADGFSSASASATSRRDEYRHESTTTTTTTRGGGGGGAGGMNLAKLTGAIQTGWKDKYGENESVGGERAGGGRGERAGGVRGAGG